MYTSSVTKTQELKFWLLDITQEVDKHPPEIWLWGIDQEGRRVLLVDRRFEHYFIAIVNDPRVEKRIASIAGVSRVSLTERKYYGRPVNAVVVYCHPKEVDKVAKRVSNVSGVTNILEQDYRYSQRYLIDNNLSPSAWHVFRVRRLREVKAQVDAVYEVVEYIGREDAPPPDLKILAFDCVYFSEVASPLPDRDPVVAIAIATTDSVEVLTGKEGEILDYFVKKIQEVDPDIIASFKGNRFHWPYLLKRAEIRKIKLHIDRRGGEPHQSLYGHFSIAGRAHFDLFDVVEEWQDVKVKTLDNMAKYLRLLPQDYEPMTEVDIRDLWRTPEGQQQVVQAFRTYAELILKITQEVLPFAIELSKLVGLPLDHVMTAATGFRVEAYLQRIAYRLKELAPPRVSERIYVKYRGGLVMAPKPGLYENIIFYDFSAMYPSLMMKYNLSPDTFIEPSEEVPEGEFYEAPEVHHKFRKKPTGLIPLALKHLLKMRKSIKNKLSKVTQDSIEYRLLKNQEKAVKVVTNAMYGYMGWSGARWFKREVSEATAAFGRATITRAIELAKQIGFEVIYSDTDSICVKGNEKKAAKFVQLIKKELGMEIKEDKRYTRALFTEAKKRYAGLLPDGTLDVVGLEVVRGDWSNVAKKVQEDCIRVLLQTKSPQAVIDRLRGWIERIKNKQVKFQDFIFWKSITRRLEDYEARAPHVVVAQELVRRGWRISVGDKVGYVVVKGSGRLYEKVKPYFLASYDELDIDYYIDKQVIPAVARILEPFGIREQELEIAKKPPKSTLAAFFQ